MESLVRVKKAGSESWCCHWLDRCSVVRALALAEDLDLVNFSSNFPDREGKKGNCDVKPYRTGAVM